MTALRGIDMGEMMVVEDLAPRLGIARSTLNEWTRRGKFPNVRLPGTRRVLIPIAWAEHYIETGCALTVERTAEGGRVVRPTTYRESATKRRREP